MRWETLNAYVDGELDAQSRHEVAESLPGTRSWPRGSRPLTQLKRGVKGSGRAAPARPDRPRRPRMGLRRGLGRPVGAGWLVMASRPRPTPRAPPSPPGARRARRE